MIVSDIKRGELHKYNLNRIPPPADIELELGCELVWDGDGERWNVFKVTKGTTPSEDTFQWQIGVPFTGSTITPGIKVWLSKYDTTRGGTYDEEQRKRQWSETFNYVIERANKRKADAKADAYYEIGHRSKHLARVAFGNKQITKPVGATIINGKPHFAFEKDGAQ